MTSIAKQNTIEALNIYHKAHVNKWEVRVSESGNVRIASWTDRFKSGFRAIFNPYRKRTDWSEKAKDAITDKLTKEITSLQKETNKDAIKDLFDRLLTKITKTTNLTDVEEILFQEDENLNSDKVAKEEPNLKSTKTTYDERNDFFEKVIPEDSLEEISLDDPDTSHIKSTVTDNTKDELVKLWKIKDKKVYGLIVEELNHAKDQDLTKATKVANYTLELIQKFGLSKDTALNAARNCNLAMENKYTDNLKDALDLVKFSEELIKKKKTEESTESIELAYYTNKFMSEKNLHIDDAVLCAKSLKGIKADKQIKNTLQAMEIAVTRLNKMKEFQKITPYGLPLNINGSATEFKLNFSSNGEEKILGGLNKLPLLLVDEYGVSNQMTKDSQRNHFQLKLKNQTIEYNNDPKNDDATFVEFSEPLKKVRQEAMLDGLKTFSNNDQDLFYGLSIIFDQAIGNSFYSALIEDFSPIKGNKNFYGVYAELNFERGELQDKQIQSIKYVDKETIQISLAYKQKINFIKPADGITIPLKNVNEKYEIDGEYTVEYKIDKIKEMALIARNQLEKLADDFIVDLRDLSKKPGITFADELSQKINDIDSKPKDKLENDYLNNLIKICEKPAPIIINNNMENRKRSVPRPEAELTKKLQLKMSEVSLNPNAKFISSSIIMRLNPDWDTEIEIQ